MGLFDLVAPHIYSGDDVADGKAGAGLFLYAAARLECRPHDCLVVEDSVNGVRAGLAAGMAVWGFTGGGHCFEGYGERLAEAGADHVIPDYKAFNAALRAASRVDPGARRR